MANNVKFKKNDDQLLVQLTGDINEETNFSAHNLAGNNSIIFDFSQVSGINSCGIREWIRWITPHSNSTKMYFRNCPKVVVDQINMVDGFLPHNAIVESFYVPYYSDETGEEKHVLFTLGVEFSDAGLQYPNTVCDSQNNPMEMDVIESKYFRFLQKFPKSA